MKSIHLIISGRVQGVGYRDWLVREARARAVNGWVRNRGQEAVEAVLSGLPEAVDITLGACYDGPFAARVTRIEVNETDAPAEVGFRRLPSFP